MTSNTTRKVIKAWAVLRNLPDIGLEELDYGGFGDNREPHLAYSVFPMRKFAKMSQDEEDKIVPCTITYSLPTSKGRGVKRK